MHESLVVEELPTAALNANPRNAHTHSKRQLRQIAASIREFGFVNPILVDEADQIIAGHGRLAAAQQLGLERVPAIRLRHLTDAQKRALAIADNKLPENAGWNVEVLAQELEFLSEIDINFDVEVTGFSTGEIDLLIERSGSGSSPDPKADEVPDPPAAEAVAVRRGDLWLLRRHRLLCGDATDAGDLRTLMNGEKAEMVFIDPPYNVPIDGHASGLGAVKHADFVMAAGEMSPSEYLSFLETAFTRLAAHSVNGAIHFVCMDWRHLYEVLRAGRSVYRELKNLCVWAKSNAGMGSLYRSRHELVLVFKNGTAPHVNNVELGRAGRHRTNVWEYPGFNSFDGERRDALQMHPTVKPVALVADAMKDCSRRGSIILDSFCGSGTTLVAAEKTGRRGYGIELDPRYVEVAIRRLAAYAGLEAVHAETGMTFAQLAAGRAPERAGAVDDHGEEHGAIGDLPTKGE